MIKLTHARHVCRGEYEVTASVLLRRCLSNNLSWCATRLKMENWEKSGAVAAHKAQVEAWCTWYCDMVVTCRGTLPAWSKFSKLEVLDLSANSIEGTLPPDYRDLKQLRVLLLSANQLCGCAENLCHAAGVMCVHCLGSCVSVR